MQKEVEVCLSNNGSTDNTREVIDRVRAEFPSVAFRVNAFDTNRGFAINLDATVRQSTGEFLFLIGDDDCFRSNGVRELLATTANTDDLLFLKNLWNLQGRMDWDALKPNQRVVYSDVSEALVSLGAFHPTFIGNFLVRREAYLAHSKSKFNNSIYPHSAIIFELARGKSVAFANVTCIEVDDSDRRVGDCSARGIAIDAARIQTEGHLQFRPKSVGILGFYKLFLRSIPRTILNERLGTCKKRDGEYSDSSLKNLLSVYSASRRAMLIAVMLAIFSRLAPCWLLRAVLR